jgi:hypothetical protein
VCLWPLVRNLSVFRKQISVRNLSACRKKISLPAIGKHTRDNLGLIVALLAAAFTAWQGYEARKARVNADQFARDTITLQKEAVDAQTQATRLDERPYVNVVPSGHQFGRHPSATGSPATLFFQTQLKLVTSGRMPAMQVNLGWECDEYIPETGPGRITKELLSGGQIEKMTSFAHLTTSGEMIAGDCTQDISPKREQIPILYIVGDVAYKDYFGNPWEEPFCYKGQFPESLTSQGRIVNPIADANEFRFVPCPNYDPKLPQPPAGSKKTN